MIKTWSYSRLTIFESCRHHAELKFIRKISEPERPLPPGKTEHANDRGTRIHEAAEAYVRGGVELIPELASMKVEFARLRDLFKAGKVSLEGEWGFNAGWNPVAYFSNDVWVRIKLDAMVTLSKTHAVVIDYKTGRKAGNEVKHAEQGQLYQIATFLRNEELEKVDVEFWYTDQDEITRVSYTRAQGLRFMKNFNNRGLAITTATDFPPSVNAFSCRWCPYKAVEKGGTGDCVHVR